MKVISAFSGCGGSSLGYEQAGCEVVAAVEHNAQAARCYRLNHPSTVMLERDIATVTGAELLEATGLQVGELDVLDSSPPCQGFSTGGSRIIDDPRNALVKHTLRLVRELQPRHAVIENVAGMMRGKMRRVAGEVITDLEDAGYQVAAGLLDAQYFGVAQLRPRVFFMASRVGKPSLPRATSRPAKAGDALRGIDPGYFPPLKPGSPTEAAAHHLLPGNAAKARQRLAKGNKAYGLSYHLLERGKPARTLIKASPTHVFHWTRRLIGVREALVLTGFPVDYELPLAHCPAWALVGNAVAPPMTREIARQVLQELG